jgi:Transposase DDE domain
MKERVDVREWIEFQWPYLMAFLGGVARVSSLARETGAFERARKIESPEVLLRLIMMWAVAERSIMDTAAIAADAGLADVSDVALVKRFAKSGDWIAALLSDLLIDAVPTLPPGIRVRLLDATNITRAGKTTTDHKLHLGLDLGSNRIDSIELTDAKGAEGLERFSVAGGQILVGDRAYGTRGGMASVDRRGAFFVVRFAWPSVPLTKADGQPFSLFEALRSVPEARPCEFRVQFLSPDGHPIAARLVAIRKSEPAAKEARKKALRERTKKGYASVDTRTLEAAGYIFVLTNLPDTITAESVLQLYRLRWQIETKFKTLKSVLHLGNVPARTDQALRVYICAKLLVALLIDSFLYEAESFSPWGYPIADHQQLAPDSPAA